MITVHHLDDSRSQRILWLLEELGLSYEIRHHKRHPQTRLAPPELKGIHPLGKSPVIEDAGPGLSRSLARSSITFCGDTGRDDWRERLLIRATKITFTGCTTPKGPECRR
jgi:hypothetical protein